MAGTGMKDIKRRIKSVESTMQITKAMELVASSKLRRAKERAENTRPYFETIYQAMAEIADNTRDFSSPYIQHTPGHKKLFICIAGDRGLAGGYNANVNRLALAMMQGVSAKVISIGKKANEFFAKQPVELLGQYYSMAEELKLRDTREITDMVLDLYQKGEVDEVHIVYTNFVSPLVQEAASLKILPLDFSVGQNAGHSLTLYEPAPQAVFDAIIPEYISGVVYGAVTESYAAEQAARRMAMENASDNAQEMIEDLSLRYNRARQSAITQELTEIVAGAEALK